MACFLFKTEPDEFSFERLQREKTARWDGITSNAALAHLRKVRRGDRVLIYHSGDERAVVGLAEIVSAPYEDPANPGKNAAGLPKFAVVDLKAVRAIRRPVTLAEIKDDARFAEFALVKQGRLSVMPVTPTLEKALIEMAEG